MGNKALSAIIRANYFGIIIFLLSGNLFADALSGKSIYDSLDCEQCHYAVGPARELTIADQLAKKGPELWYAGSKFQRSWMETWLVNPTPIRVLKYYSLDERNPSDHISLSADDALQVTDFLMSRIIDNMPDGLIQPKTHPKGRLVFKKKMGCDGCHQYKDRKQITGGLTGPSLVDAGKRLNPDWIYAYLANPDVFKPIMMMPSFKGLLTEKEMQYVSAYIANFRSD